MSPAPIRIATYPVSHPNFPGKSALIKRLTIEAIVPLKREFSSLTTTNRHRTMSSKAAIVRISPASSSLRSERANRFLQRLSPVIFLGKQGSVKYI